MLIEGGPGVPPYPLASDLFGDSYPFASGVSYYPSVCTSNQIEFSYDRSI